MTKHQENKAMKEVSGLLTAQDRTVCERIAGGIAPHSQRAKALLVLNAEGTAAVAAEQSGLTVRQVRYWLTRFKNQGVSIFTDTQKKVASAAPAPKKTAQAAKPAAAEVLIEVVEKEVEVKPSKGGAVKSIRKDKKEAKRVNKKLKKDEKKDKKKIRVAKRKVKKIDKKINKDKTKSKKDKKKNKGKKK